MEPMDAPGVDRHIWVTTPNLTPMKGGSLLKFPDRDRAMEKIGAVQTEVAR